MNRTLLKFFPLAGIIGCLVAPAGVPFQLRLGSGEKAVERYAEYNYNAAILGDVTQLASFDATFPGAITNGSALRERIEQQRAKFEKACVKAKKLGLAVCVMTDEASLPIPIIERIGKPGLPGSLSASIDLDSEKFWEAFRAKYREVLKAYPCIAYVMIRTGENYSHPDEGFVGRTVIDGEIDENYYRHMTRLIEETRKIVVDEFGHTLIWRTWDLGNDGFHASPKVYDRVLAGLTERKGLMFAIKHTQTDFWRYNDFNPNLGRGGVEQIVEFQCAREYEGKGAFPNYVGTFFAEDFRKAVALGVTNTWVWDFSGGWGGPFLKSDRWVRLNITAASRLAQDPAASPRQIAEEWAAKEFGAKAATNVADMLMLSSECVRKFRYIEPYARDHRGWKPSLNIMRDDIIRGEVLKQLYDGSKKLLPEVFAEKDEAVALAKQMRELFEKSRADIVAERGEQVYRESLSSLIYMENLADVMRHYVNGMFSYYNWQETGDATMGAQAKQELLAWRAAWSRYQTDVPQLPGVASLYRSQNAQSADSVSGAMAELCEAALHKLENKSGSHSTAQAGGSSASTALQLKN
jgi:hypothetical protein